ncbi:hypothetical protein [Streptomyces sp. ID05-04B]|uniref:hypothetical protein n=1 Tax=Streptomyces sp. ID05-04B TaxID=3028661 RepID=UPI0029C9EBED|nr:hypothetical protein [Streptomyces sp. ID05-04B]
MRDARLDVEHRMNVMAVGFKNGSLYVEARATMPAAGSVEDGDVVSIFDPDRRLVTRFWLTIPGRGYEFAQGDTFTLMLPISLGGPGGMAFADMTFDLGGEKS